MVVRDLGDVLCLYNDRGEPDWTPQCEEVEQRLREAHKMANGYTADDEFIVESEVGVRYYETGETLLWYEAQRELMVLTKQHMARTGADFKTAFAITLKGSPELARTYARVPDMRFVEESVVKVPPNPGEEIVFRVATLRRKQPHLSYEEAYHKVLDADPALKFAYAESRNTERR